MGRAVSARNLLVVDADSISRTVLKHAFALRGHNVRVAATAAEALATAASSPPDVIIYDWSFRDDSGVGLAKKLRAACPAALVIVVLSVLDPPDGFCDREEVDDYIVKPAMADSVELAFEAALTRRRPSPDAAP
jgi:two-component system, OmpR family, response regulator PrrA